ncbi:MAG: diguanylate cyclase [Leptolyngbya sp. DLM2.Bin27]|nr:MAG: diguanylate cyclase [Leptolyngbya sp. DLM2.Bin27]
MEGGADDVEKLADLVQQLRAENAVLQREVVTLRDINQALQAALERSRPPTDIASMEAPSAARWQFALEGSGDGLWDWNIQTNEVYFSPQWKAMLGYEDHEIGTRLDEWDNRVHPDDKAGCYADLERHFSGETPIYQNEHRMRCKDGSYKWILDRGQVMQRDAQGQPLRVIGMHTDVSDRRQTEDNLRQSEATNRAILAAMPDLLLRVGRDGTCHDFRPPANAAAGVFLPIHHHLSEVVPPDLLTYQLRRIEQALDTGNLQVWEQQFEIQGEMHYEEVRLTPCGPDECLVVVRDISDRKVVELALQAATTELERFFSVSLDLLCIADTDGYFHRLNPAWEKVLGYPLAALEQARFLNYVHPEDLDSTLETLSRLNQQQEIIGFVNRYRCHDGSYRWLEWRSVPVGNQIYAAARDITLNRQAKLDLESTKLQLTGVLNSSLDGIMAFRSVRDQAGAIVDFEWLLSNPAACALVGRTAEYLVGRRLLEEMPGNKTDGLFDLYVDVVTSGNSIQRQFHYTHDGINTWFENIAVKLEDGFAVTFRDITPLKQAAYDLQQANQQLETRVEELDQRNQQMQLLGKMSDFLQTCLKVEEVYPDLSTLIKPLFPNSTGGIFIINDCRDRVENVAIWGDQLDSTLDFSPQDCWALRRGLSHQVGPECLGLRCHHTEAKATTTLCIPLVTLGEALGLFYLSTARIDRPTQQLARTVAEQIALTLAKLHLREKLQQQSICDPLTGLYNRRYLKETLGQVIHHAQRHRHTVGVIMLDIDHFKQFNDTYGHEAGDRVLQVVGQLLRDSVRDSDVACRYGGEEMTLVLPDSPPEVTLARAEAIRQGIGQLRVEYNGVILNPLSASLGVASFPDYGPTGNDVVKAADAALYEAKAQGRNRVVAAPTVPGSVPAAKVADSSDSSQPRDIS